jgi:WD40 repeat protein
LALSGSGWPQGDRTLRLWEVASGKEIRRFDMTGIPLNPEKSGPREAPREVYCLEFTPDGKQAAAGICGGAVGLWDVSTGKLVRQFEGHTGTVYGLAVSNKGDRVLTGGRDSTARLWDAYSGAELLRIESSAAHVRGVAFSPDGKRALLGGWDHKMRLWDLESAQQLAETKVDDCCRSVAFSPSGGRAASAAGNTVCVWDLAESDTLRRLLELKHPGGVTCVAFSPDGTRLLTGGYDMNVRLWDTADGELVETYQGHRGWVFGVAFSPDGSLALSGGGGRYTANRGTNAGIDFALRLWRLPKKQTRVVKPK